MIDAESLVRKAAELKESGLTLPQISEELHLSQVTVNWLLSEETQRGEPPADVKIGWRSAGVFGSRIGMLASAMSSIIVEEMEAMETDFDTVVGVYLNGIPLATLISDQLDKELAICRPSKVSGSFSSNYASVKGKKVVIADDVLSSGLTSVNTIAAVKENGGTPLLVVVLVNKTGKNDIGGIPLRAIIRARGIETLREESG